MGQMNRQPKKYNAHGHGYYLGGGIMREREREPGPYKIVLIHLSLILDEIHDYIILRA